MIDKREIIPDFLARVAGLVFTKVRFEDVLRDAAYPEGAQAACATRFDALTHEALADLMMEDIYFRQSYSRLECVSYARGLIDYVNKASQWRNRRVPTIEDKLNVFDLLLVALDDLLLVNHRDVECSYAHILSWRMLYQAIGEELPVSAKHALWDYSRGHSYRSGGIADRQFDWPYVTPHNNKPLDRLMQRGIADHHSHLWGSAPYFHVSWINIMNHLTNSTYIQNLRNLPLTQWADTGKDISYGEALQMRAGWIRWYLCDRLFSDANLSLLPKPKELSRELQIVCDCTDWYPLMLLRDSLQSRINACGAVPSAEPDYALNLFPWKISAERSDYRILVGERGLYYYVFLDYCKHPQERRLSRTDFALFYAYCLIRTRIREQMVQVNNRIGFDNFQTIEKRKWYFLSDAESLRYLSRLAVNQVLNNSSIRELELRISPYPADLIQLERYIHRDPAYPDWEADTFDPSDDQYYYVFHFLKNPDSPLCRDHAYSLNLQCRMESFRGTILRQALKIIDFRRDNPEMACKLKGIDAAAQEIECRPELFARVYRLLGDYRITYDGFGESQKQLPELGKTYHVGEDFLDIVDGLRAIDEAIHFLDLDCGDRIGHAIVLGTDVEEWYEKKHRRISLSVQDYLDNLAWFCHALNHLFVPNRQELQDWLEQEFEYWFRIVYRNNILDSAMESIMDEAKTYYAGNAGEDHGLYQSHHCHFDIQSYYHAWTMRGDDPSCYVHGYFRKPEVYEDLISCEAYKDNKVFPVRYEDRYIPEYSMLNFYYQYDARVWEAGRRRISIEVPVSYIAAAKVLQVEMRSRIARRGIAIEANPTSNVQISTFRQYKNHPLPAFFNRGLPVTAEEDANCAQLSVSINTDDSGVFCTNLEMEYAFMVRALEMVEDSGGKPRFTTNDIHTWADNIRRMGLEQSFNFKQ